MRQTIYFGNKTLRLTTESIDDQKGLAIRNIDDVSIKQLVAATESGKDKSVVLVHPDLNAAMEAIKKQFHFIQAAGGAVWSDKSQMLLIFRKGKWDLPKGKLDEGEDLAQCAVREVAEETGLKNISIVQPLCITYHTYYQRGKHYLKESHWYLMQAPQMEDLAPQTEEDIEQCVWVKPEALGPYFENMHGSVSDVLQAALPLLQ